MSNAHAANPANWERLEALYEAASALPASERAAFLDAECAGDDVLRRELESLLASAPASESFFSRISDAVWTLIADQVAEPPDELVGAAVGRYRIEARLGAGGMGVVYRAYDVHLQRIVALKLLVPHLSEDEGARQRFLTEARAAAAIDHPNVCPIHEAGETEVGQPFLAMAYCDGETLKAKIARGAMATEEALVYAAQIAQGLAVAHERGIVHRDVKPGNVIVTAGGLLKLVDFGLAQSPDVSLSAPGLTPGTVAYMAPEQLRGGRIDARADLWSLGVVLYEMLTGARPFGGERNEAVAFAVANEEPAPLTGLRPDLPAEVQSIVLRLLQKDPELRYASAAEFLSDLATAGTSGQQPGGVQAHGLRRSPAGSGAADAASPRGERWPRPWLAAAAVVLIGLAAFAVARSLRSSRMLDSRPQASLGIGILPVEDASALENLTWLTRDVEAGLSYELVEVPGLALATRENIAAGLTQGLPLTTIALSEQVDYFVRATVAERGPDSVVARLFLNEGGIRDVKRGMVAVARRDGPIGEILGREVARQLRRMLGSRIRERQLEEGSGNQLAVELRRRADHHRLSAQQSIDSNDLGAAELALDSANALLVQSGREDPDWVVPRLESARLSELRATLILYRRPGDLEGVRRTYNQGITAVKEVLEKKPDDPLALALRGRLRWQRTMLGEARPMDAAVAIDSARRDLQAAVGIDTTLARPAADLSQLLFEAYADYSSAAVYAERAYRIDAFLEETSSIIDRLAQSRFELGQDSVAATWCAAGLRASPNNPAPYGCFLELMAWGSGPAIPDSAWAWYRRLAQYTTSTNVGARAHFGIAVAAVLARAPDLPRDSTMAVLTRVRRLVTDSTDATSPLRDEIPALEAGVWFRLGDSARGDSLFRQYEQRNQTKAGLLASRRVLRGYVSSGVLRNPR